MGTANRNFAACSSEDLIKGHRCAVVKYHLPKVSSTEYYANYWNCALEIAMHAHL